MGMTFVSSGISNDLFVNIGGSRAGSATTNYFSPVGTRTGFTSVTEADCALAHQFAVTVSNLRMFLSANTYATDATVRMRKAGVDVAQNLTLTAGATGYFEDPTNTDAFSASDEISLSITGGTSGSVSVEILGVTEQEIIAGAPMRGLCLSNFGYVSYMQGH
jgi:hypothetical protein